MNGSYPQRRPNCGATQRATCALEVTSHAAMTSRYEARQRHRQGNKKDARPQRWLHNGHAQGRSKVTRHKHGMRRAGKSVVSTRLAHPFARNTCADGRSGPHTRAHWTSVNVVHMVLCCQTGNAPSADRQLVSHGTRPCLRLRCGPNGTLWLSQPPKRQKYCTGQTPRSLTTRPRRWVS